MGQWAAPQAAAAVMRGSGADANTPAERIAGVLRGSSRCRAQGLKAFSTSGVALVWGAWQKMHR